MTPQPLPPPPQQQQPKTVLGVVLLLLFGALACCGGAMALGAYGAYTDAQKKKLTTPSSLDAGAFAQDDSDDADLAPTGDDDAPPTGKSEEQALKEEFAQELLAELDQTGHPGFTFDRKRYRLSNQTGEHIELGNLFREYQEKNDDERLAFVEKVAAMYGQTDLPESWAAAKSQVLVTVRDRITLEVLPLRSKEASKTVSKALADDLVQVAVFDGPDKMQYLTTADLESWGVDEDTVFLEGRKNLVAKSKKPFGNPSPGVYESKWADNHDVGRALLFESLKKLKLKGDPVVFLPQRDHLVITGSRDPAGQEAAAALLDTYLALPRANSGRGWVVKDGGFEPFVPPAGTRLAELRQQALANDANEQKKALDEKFEADGTDIFVGTTLFTEDDDGKPLTYAVWTKGADTLMPKADFVVLVDIDRPEADRVIGAAPWDTVFKLAGSKMKPDPSYWPLRYRLKTFPDAKTVKAIGLHHFFTRNKGGKGATDQEPDENADGE